jgi:xylan 1,4-beta-xylosidase
MRKPLLFLAAPLAAAIVTCSSPYVLQAGLTGLQRVRANLVRGGVQAGPARAAYENPVLQGDFPDPSVIRVGREYWATATTSQWAPIFPLLHSTDLVNWRRVGSVFVSPPGWSAGSYWAPEIAAHGGRFFVYYTARKKGGPLCVAVADADRPQGPFTDRGPLVCQEVGSIDAVPVTDENGRRYLVWKEDGNSRKLPTPLWAQPLSSDGTRLTDEKQEILRNAAPWEAHLVEGPFIQRRGGWFYMFYSADACCGRQCNYRLGVARSRTLLGPWDRHASNPILAGNEHWKCPGHGSIVDDPSGRTFLLYHAYHPNDFEYVGRQGLLDEIRWRADGWPEINGGHGPSRSAPLPRGAAANRPAASFVDEFTSTALDPDWQWPWDQSTMPSAEPARGGRLRVHTGTGSLAVAARPTLTGTYVATTTVDVASVTPGARAGLAAFGNRDNLLAITMERARDAGPLQVAVWRTQKGERTTLTTGTIEPAATLHFRLRATDRTRFELSVSSDGRQWKTMTADARGDHLPPWDLSVRTAVLVAGPNASAMFDVYKLESIDR